MTLEPGFESQQPVGVRKPLIALILTDFTARNGRHFAPYQGEAILLFKFFNIGAIGQIGGSRLPFEHRPA